MKQSLRSFGWLQKTCHSRLPVRGILLTAECLRRTHSARFRHMAHFRIESLGNRQLSRGGIGFFLDDSGRAVLHSFDAVTYLTVAGDQVSASSFSLTVKIFDDCVAVMILGIGLNESQVDECHIEAACV